MTRARLSPSGPPIDVETTTDGIENLSTVPGTNVTQALDFLLSARVAQFFDEFLGGTSTTLVASNDTGAIGSLAWNFVTTGGSCARNTADPFIGAYDITSNAGTLSAIYLITTAATTGGLPVNVIDRVEWRVLPTPTATTRVGLGVAPNTTSLGNDGIYFSASSASPFWRVITRTGGITTNTVTTPVSWATGQPFDLVLVRNSSGNWNFFINEVFVVNISVSITTSRLVPVVQTEGAGTAVADTFRMDYTKVAL